MNFLASRPIKSEPGTWLLEADDYVVYVSRSQISGLLPKSPPFVTSGYWDDIALAAAGVPEDAETREMLVLGSGIGSFLPLALTLRPSLQFRCVEINAEVSAAAQRMACKILPPSVRTKMDWHAQPAETLDPSILPRQASVFIDIYKPEGISAVSIDESLHHMLTASVTPDALIWINVYDQVFGAVQCSPTEHFVRVLSGHYRGIVAMRRSASSTLVCSQAREEDLQQRLQAILEEHPGIWPEEFYTPMPGSRILKREAAHEPFNPRMLEFESQRGTTGTQAKIGTGLAARAVADLATLEPSDLVRLSRRKAHILDW